MTDLGRDRVEPLRDRSAATAAIFLAGFMGSGKSTIGRSLASRLNWRFADLDDEIERLAGQTIPSIFDNHGEDAFRGWEHEALREQAEMAVAGDRAVLALGGGTYAFARNRELMRPVGPALWLDAPSNVLWERVRHAAHRPLARDRDAFLRLFETRHESYAKADHRIDASLAPDEVLERILGLRWGQRLIASA